MIYIKTHNPWLQKLFYSHELACAICRKPYRGAQNALGLCLECYSSIPWITRVICPVCGRGEECPDCKRERQHYFRMNRSAVRYDNKMKDLLALYKYRGDERLAFVLGGMLLHPYSLLLEELRLASDSERPRKQEPIFDFITFVPVSEERFSGRGFNQAEQLARVLGEKTGIPVEPFLYRVRATTKQSFKTRGERIKDMKGAFGISEEGMRTICKTEGKPSLKNTRRLVLIDDVYTTGSTMNECAFVLTDQAGVEVFGLTWAR